MQIVISQVLVDLMKSLQRFFKIGVYYPTGHSVADQAASSFLHLLKTVVGKKDTYLRFVVSENGLSVQSIDLDYSLPAVKHFHDLLYPLRISILDIHRGVTAEEFRSFLARLLFLRTTIKNYSDFQQIEISGLPSTIKIQQMKFLACQAGSGEEGDSSEPTIDLLLSSLNEYGLHKDQVSMCRNLLEAIPETLAKRQLAESDLPSVTWKDVEQLLRNVATSIHSEGEQPQDGQLPEHHQNVDALVAILKSIENTAGGTQSRDAVNLLIQVARGAPPESLSDDQDSAPVPPPRKQPTITVDELCRVMFSLKERPLPSDFTENNRAEELSVLLQMLGLEEHLYSTLKMQEVLRNSLSVPLEPLEWRVVIRGTRYLLTRLEREHAEAIMIMLIDILRRSEHTEPLVYLYEVCQELSKKEFLVCWPFLINEAFIAGPKGNLKLFKEVCFLTGILSSQDLQSNLGQLERLEGLYEKSCAPDVFAPPPASLCPLFILLLKSSHGPYIYEKIIFGLRRHSLGELDHAVAPLLDARVVSHRKFIMDLLHEQDQDAPSKDLIKQGALIIVERLPQITQELRNAEWVAGAIDILAEVRVAGGREFLDSIILMKNYGVFHNWPGLCREAAHRAWAEIYQYDKRDKNES